MIALSISKRAAASGLTLAVLLVWALLGDARLQAQNQIGRPSLLDASQANPLLQIRQRALESSLRNASVALEGAVDPTEYIVGPGDQFSISIGGIVPTVEVSPISAEGNLVLPEAGSIPAAGRTLDAVRSDALTALQEHYENVSLEVALVQPRQFYIHLSGAVPEPGRYLMVPVSRVSDALELAYEFAYAAQTSGNPARTTTALPSATSERPDLNEDFRPALRNIRLTHRDGTEHQIDLIRYFTTGNTDHNPYLLDGDVVMVPTYHIRRDAVRVSGEVAYPGTFDHRPGDTVLDLLTLATGPTGLAALDEMRLTRTHPDGRTEIMPLNAQAILSGQRQPPAVQPGDHLNVLPEEIAQAAIQGRIVYPGTYRIENGKTTLRELVDLAGGLKPDANLRAAFLERRKSLDFRESGRVSNLDFFSRAYAQTFAEQQESRVIVDIEAALQPGGEDIVLYDEDRVVFPRNEGTVFVMGNVPQPGYVEYAEGQRARYYIDQAGGPGPDSKTIYVFEDGTGEVRIGEDSIVRSGDTVFIDRRDIAESPQIAQLLLADRQARRQTRVQTTQLIIAGVTAITSVITAFVAVRSID